MLHGVAGSAIHFRIYHGQQLPRTVSILPAVESCLRMVTRAYKHDTLATGLKECPMQFRSICRSYSSSHCLLCPSLVSHRSGAPAHFKPVIVLAMFWLHALCKSAEGYHPKVVSPVFHVLTVACELSYFKSTCLERPGCMIPTLASMCIVINAIHVSHCAFGRPSLSVVEIFTHCTV